MMKAIFSIGLLAALATGLVLPPVENPVLAQAPTGPQGGSSPRQQNPTPQTARSARPARESFSKHRLLSHDRSLQSRVRRRAEVVINL